jgi:hypothetical protein
MDEDILKHIKECLKCQTLKSNKFSTITSLQPMPQFIEPNQSIYVDCFGSCKTSGMRSKYVFIITEAYTKYAEIFAISNKEAETVTDMVLIKWIYRYGCP